MTLLIVSVGILACVFLSNFFSSSEMAYSSCNHLRLENAAEEGSRKAKTALFITNHFDDALSAILIGNNLVNIASSSLASVLVILATGNDKMTWAATLLLTVVIIIFGETIPKITAKQNANRVAEKHAVVVRILMFILKPIIVFVVGLVRLLTFWMKVDENHDEEAVEELQSLIETAEDEEVLDEDRSELVQAAIDFSEICAYEVMTARVDVEAVDIDDDWDDILVQIEKSSFSRLPVYEDGIDHIIGVLVLNRFLKAVADGQREIRPLLMEPCYIYKTMKLPDVMAQLRKAKQHLAIVCDEYGGTLGVLSMEDVIEQIVGEIWDETDPVENENIKRSEDEYELDGDMPISEFLELLEIPEDEFDADSDTLGGWAIESLGGVFPEPGTSFRYHEIEVTILAMEGRRVERLLIRKNSAAE